MKGHKFFVLGLMTFFVLKFQLVVNTQPKEELFPLPENLKPNVKFWLKIYAQYDQNQIVIHDSENLDIIYEVINLSDLFGDKDISEKDKWKKIEIIKDDYRDLLRKLSRKQFIDPESLDDKERYVSDLFESNQSPDIFENAIRNIRAQAGLKDQFEKGLVRSGKYISKIIETLQKYNLPLELAYLPHVESSFNNKAYSKFGAAGLWQFTRGTGRLYLNINYTVDERFHPEIATDAAARLLKHNFETLGTWPLAITAYNHGVNGLKKAIQKIGTTDIGEITKKYKSRQFGFASRNFYAEFLAAIHVSQNYRYYFGEIQFEKPDKFIELEIPYYVKISTLQKQFNLTYNDIKELNPSLRASVLNSNKRLPKGFKLRIPWREDFNIDRFYANIPISEKQNQQIESSWYQVEKGDNLKNIAKKFNTTVDEILAYNENIKNSHKIYVNQIIRLPQKNVELTSGQYLSTTSQTTSENLNFKWYQIRRGENLETIAQKFGTSTEKVMAINNIKDKNQIFEGQLIQLPLYSEVDLASTESSDNVAEPSSIDYKTSAEVEPKFSVKHQKQAVIPEEQQLTNYWYEVKAGDNLKKIADKYRVLLKDLMAINNIENSDLIRIGQTLIIPATGANADQSHLLANNTNMDFYTVQPGDNLEKIASYFGIAVQDLKKANQLENKNKIYTGQNLVIPQPTSQLGATEIGVDNFHKTEEMLQNQSGSFEQASDKIYVLPDETLGHFADWLEIPTQKLRELNGLTFDQEIQLGQQIKIIYSNVRKEVFQQRRMEYHRGIEEDFFSSYSVSGVQIHKLKRGENIWYLCNEVYEVPYWLMIKYNQNINFNQLHKGDEIIIPVITALNNGNNE